MSLSIAIVGLPNVGKSTLFNALLKKQVALAANYPFATIEPNVGVAEVPDERLAVLAEIVAKNHAKELGATKVPIIPAAVEFVDVAGLVRGAHKGEGLGNQFLAYIRECDAICHVLRDFSDPSVLREGVVNPKEDLATIRTELQLADLATLEKQQAPKGAVDKLEKLRWEIVENFRQNLANGVNIFYNGGKGGMQKAKEKVVAEDLCLLAAKPEIFVINVDENQVARSREQGPNWAEALRVSSEQIVTISAKIESELAVLAEEDQKLYLAELGLRQSGLESLAGVAHQTLSLQSFLTAGVKEIRAWTIPKGARAQEAAGVIHSDFEQKFIKAKVVSYDDFVTCHGWAGAREQGKVRLEGRDYQMQEGDVVEFMIGS